METAGGSRIVGSAAGVFLHALLVILYASLQPETVRACDPDVTLNYTESNFAIKQTRVITIDDFNTDQCSFQVWGVATILVGGANSNNQFYWFDCFHNSFDDDLTWIRVEPAGTVDNSQITGGTRISFTQSSGSENLGLYACRASDGSMKYLNITDAVPGLVPVVQNVEVLAGETATLSTYISTTNGQLRLVRWEDPSDVILTEYPGPGEEVTALPSHLHITDVTLEDSGTYNVTVQSHEFGVNYKGHTLVSLAVLVPSNITAPPPSEEKVDEWEEVELVCVARGSAPLTISWSREDGVLPVNSPTPTSSTTDNPNGTVTVTSILVISEVRYNDRGVYRCTAFNHLTTVNHTATADSTLSVNPMIRIESDRITGNNIVVASFGTTIVIDCFGSGILNWTTPTNQTVFTTYDPSRNVLTLTIPNFLVPYRYTCTSDLGLQKSILIDTEAGLSVFISDKEIFALRGSPVIIAAHIHSVDDVTSVLWYRNGTLLDPESDDRLTASVSENALATLEIASLGDEDVGRYVVMVTGSDNSVANASVEVTYPKLPSAVVYPSQHTVEVGDMVDVFCTAEGTRPLSIEWSLNSEVVAVGNRLTIATASLVHSGLYTCTVSSPYSAAEATFDLIVLERLVALIEYNDVISHYHKVSFRHGDGNPPSFRCLVMSNGSISDTTITWQLSGGEPLPGVTTSVDASHTLTWTHRLEYTDSGTYQCVVREPATGRESVASANLTVLHDAVLDTIFPASPITKGPSSIAFSVPLGFTGTALTCSAFAWPTPPDIKWSKNSGSLPRGIDVQMKVEGGMAISELIFSSQFSVADVGTYKCEVRESGEEEIVDSQLVELSQGDPGASSDGDCEKVSADSVLFQLRVATSDCLTWNQDTKSAITEEFQNLLFRLLSTQCDHEDCCVSKETLTVVSLECSDVIEGGAVFRGSIETGSASKTEMVTCAFSHWQRSQPLVTVENNRFLVDSGCGLWVESYAEEECVEPEREKEMDISMLLMIVVPVGGVTLLILGVILMVVCSFCCRKCRRENLKISDGIDAYEVNTLSYRQTGEQTYNHRTTSLGHRMSVESMTRQGDNPFYNDTPFDRYQPASPVYESPDRRPLVPPESLPKDLEKNFNDSGVSLSAAPGSGSPPHEPRRAQVTTAAQPYQIPTASNGSLNQVGVANPMWGVERNPAHHQRERRLSEGPLPHSPARLGGGAVSCVAFRERGLTHSVGGQLTRDQTTGVSASSEDYSHLDFTPPSKSVSCLGAPQRKWYVTSEGSYASLHESETAIRPYAAVRSSHVHVSPASSPQTKTPPTAPPPGPRGLPSMMSPHKNGSQLVNPSSFHHMKQQLIAETQSSLV